MNESKPISKTQFIVLLLLTNIFTVLFIVWWLYSLLMTLYAFVFNDSSIQLLYTIANSFFVPLYFSFLLVLFLPLNLYFFKLRRKNQKRKFIIISVICIFINSGILGGLLFNSYIKDFINPPEKILERAIATEDYSLCETYDSRKYDQETCLSEVAIKKGDISMCRSLRTNNNDAIVNCFGMIALQRNDASLCEVGQFKTSNPERYMQLTEKCRRFVEQGNNPE